MFFENVSEFIYALYFVKYSRLSNEEKFLRFNNIYLDYLYNNEKDDEFEKTYNDLINFKTPILTTKNIEYLKRFNGRIFTINELLFLKIKIHYLDSIPSIKKFYSISREKNFYCKFCKNTNSNLFFSYDFYNDKITYCRNCLEFNRRDNFTLNFHFDFSYLYKNDVDLPKTILSPLQKEASNRLLANYKNNKSSLVWAVCGAGKTQIVYELIYNNLLNNKKICFAVPRVDIARELYIRFKNDFKNLDINFLTGNVKIFHSTSSFFIMTTHQLTKYYNFFDTIIIDEIDAFPYDNNKILQNGVKNALLNNGNLIYLSATPSKEVKKLSDDIIKIPIRYHKNLLPIPKIKIEKNLLNNKKLLSLKNFIKDSLARDRKVLIFSPTITMCEEILSLLSDFKNISTISSIDKNREKKIINFREGKIKILITTTILERGVTFDFLDVVVFFANHTHFTKEALIQISGRVGRKNYDVNGDILFLATEYNLSMKQAIKEIKYMNELAKYKKLTR